MPHVLARLARLIAALLVLAALTGAPPAGAQKTARAQIPDAPTPRAQAARAPSALTEAALSETAQISLLTVLPGDDIPSMYGHSALRVRDPARGIDRTYNYGTYDFGDPLFIPKFIYGQMRYFLAVGTFTQSMRRYRSQRRPVIEQTLRLTPAEENALFRALEQNARPENRYYLYDFFYDNCSTRVRDILKAVLGERLAFTGAGAGQRSFRRLIDPYAANRPALDAGMDLLLGTPADRDATPWQAMFLPDYLMTGFEQARVTRGGEGRGSGMAQPLVARTDTLYWPAGYERPQPAAHVLLWIGWMLVAAALGLTAWEWRRGRPIPPLPDALLLFAAGLAGLLIAFMVLVSQHVVTRPNLHLLWAWPTHLWAAAALLRHLHVHRQHVRSWHVRLLRGYLAAAAAAALIVALGWPLWPQQFPIAALPLVLLLALRAGWRAYALRLARLAPAPA